MTPPSEERVTQAHRWMGQLPREQFDLLLTLINEATERGRREATAPLLDLIEGARGAISAVAHVAKDQVAALSQDVEDADAAWQRINTAAEKEAAALTAALAQHRTNGDG